MFSSTYVEVQESISSQRVGKRVELVRSLAIAGLAGRPGFEPSLTGSEPVVVPLNHPPKGRVFRRPSNEHRRPLQGQVDALNSRREGTRDLVSAQARAPPASDRPTTRSK